MASNWKSPSKLLGRVRPRPRSSPSMCTLTSSVDSAHYEEDACLIRPDKRGPKSVLDSSTTASTSYSSSPDILGTFCHLMHYVVHLRRENRHLRKRVLCLNEMRQIEKLQNELFRTGCTCDSGRGMSRGKNERNRAHWRHSMPVEGFVENKSSVSTNSKYTAVSVTTNTTRPVEQMANEKRSRVGVSGHTQTAPVTTSLQQQAPSKSSFLAPPTTMITRNRPVSGGGAASGHCQKTVGKTGSNWVRRSLLAASTLSKERGIRNGAEEALAESIDERSFTAMNRSIGEDSSYSPRSLSSGGSWSMSRSVPGHGLLTSSMTTDSDPITPTTNTFFHSHPRYSDSDNDQSVFTEVQLPDYRKSSNINDHKTTSGSWRYNDPAGPGLVYVSPDSPVYSTSQKGSILGRIGFRRPSVLFKKRMNKTTSFDDDSTQGKKKLFSPLVSKSLYSEKIGYEDQQPNSETPQVEPDKWKLAKKAFLKKRKRKISESDSLASSDASGKSCVTIELPEINYYRKASYPVSIHNQNTSITTTKADINDLSQNASKGYTRKMQQWQEKQINVDTKHSSMEKKQIDQGSLIRRMSQKGQMIKRRWLKPKCADEMTVDESNGGMYFEEDGRQNTVIENETQNGSVEWTASELDRKAEVKGISQVREGLKGTSASGYQQSTNQQQQQHKVRSVTFLEQLSPLDRSNSMTASQQLTNSDESVFTSLNANSNCGQNGPRSTTTTMMTEIQRRRQQQQQQQQEEDDKQKQASDVVEQLLLLQERNSLLIGTLKDKTKEYERITERLCDLEKEIQTLRERHRFDTNLEQLYNAVFEPNYVPITYVREIEEQIDNLDQNIRVVKSEAYDIQQMALETHANDQATTMKYLNQIDSLQKANFHLLSKTLSEINRNEYPEIRRQLELLPTYEALYNFAVSLLRKMKHLRTKLLEKNVSVSKLDLELLQTQSSLLLAHAQMERQKMEIRLLNTKYSLSHGNDGEKKIGSLQAVRRTHSYHGQDILARAVDAGLSFYLPFKLHGFHTAKKDHRDSNRSLCHEDEALELEFAKLFDTVNRLSGHYYEIQVPPPSTDDKRKLQENRHTASNDSYSSFYGTSIQDKTVNVVSSQLNQPRRRNELEKMAQSVSTRSQQQPRPISCHASMKDTDVKRIAEEIAAGRYFMSVSTDNNPTANNFTKEPPSYLKKAPPPLKLGNVGQVKAIAAAFDVSAADETTSAPNTPANLLLVPRPVKDVKMIKSIAVQASRRQAVKPASHCLGFERQTEEMKGSRIPVRNEGQPVKCKKRESPYETLNFMCRETDFFSPPPSIPSTSGSFGMMEKSMSPDAETVSSVASMASSNWSISKRNEVKKLQFFYGPSSRQCHYPEMPSSPVPSLPAPKTPPTPVPPTPTPPNSGSHFPEFFSSHATVDNGARLKMNAGRRIKGSENFRKDPVTAPVASTTVAPPAAVKGNQKKTSWFQKLRYKN